MDDDASFLQVIKRILNAKGYETEVAISAGEALSKAQERGHNLAIIDISLPDLAGTELLPRLIEGNPDIIAVMLTGCSSVQSAIQSLNRGAFAYLEKPVDPEHLLSVVTRGLERQRLVLENRRLIEELQKHDRETSVLLSVSQAVSQSLELEKIIDTALDRVSETMATVASYVHLYEDGRLVLARYHGFSHDLVPYLESGTVQETEFEHVLQTRELFMSSSDAGKGDGFEFLYRAGYRCYAGVPLTIMGQTIGVMGLAMNVPDAFKPEDLKLMMGIAREISIAIRNAQLYEEASSNKALRELDALRTEFLANVSHELRTPLASIKGFASTLLQPDVEFDKDSWFEFLRTIDKEADRLKRLIEDLLVTSCLEAGRLEVRRESRRLNEIVRSIEDRLQRLATRHRLQFRIPAGLPAVLVDEEHIGEVITNLVENAVKSSKEGSSIIIEARSEEGAVITSVCDQGIGVPSEFHLKIFERFYQLEGENGEHRPGAGLGLSICRGIVEAHGGRIWVESEPHNGARFSFSLPVEIEGFQS